MQQLQRVQRMGPLPAPASEHRRQAPLLVLFTLSSDGHANRSHLCDASCNVSHRLDLFQSSLVAIVYGISVVLNAVSTACSLCSAARAPEL